MCEASVESCWCYWTVTLLVGRQEGHPSCKKQWWDAGVVIYLGWDAYGPADATATHYLLLQ